MIEVKITEGVKVEIRGVVIEVSGPLGVNKRSINDRLLSIKKNGETLVLEGVVSKKLGKKGIQAENSFAKELKNDMAGVTKLYEINMKIVFAHFPISIEVKGNEVRINNMIGERAARISKIVGATKVEVKGQDLRVYGTSLDEVSQTAANLRTAVKIRDKDSRTFQDGIYHSID
jgi:large subunit ribosomal protein L6